MGRKSDDLSLIHDLRAAQLKETYDENLFLLEVSVRTDNYHIFYDEVNNPVGYIVWANVNRESLYKIQRTGLYPKYPYEWHEGKITLILDVAINDTNKAEALRQIKVFMKKQKIVAYTKKSIGKLHIRQKQRLTPKGQQRFAELVNG
jgi:hemolysin-activating ACP:hemolysin acyltransferase